MNLLDGGGIYGTLLSYGLTFSYMGSAFVLFIYLYRKSQLDMDEGPKFEMMKKDHDEEIFHDG